ncbi:MAG: hypothetical protein WKG32_15600 [Gemmatimonadaceae bacterium]
MAAPPITLGHGVDTSNVVVRDIVRAVAGYLRLPRPGVTPTEFWHPEEQARQQAYDPAQVFVTYREPATIIQVTPDVPDDSVYVVKILYARADSTGARIRPTGLQRLYAVQYESRWVLMSALGRLTRQWRQSRVGPLIYHYAADHPFDQVRAARAAAFVDSLARALAVSPPDSIHYYLAPSSDEMARVLGLDWMLLPSGPGTGRGGWGGVTIYSGDPRQGEAYLHELAHTVAGRVAGGGYGFIQEGFATFVSGSGDVPFAEILALLTDFQRRHASYPWPRLRSYGDTEGQRVMYASGALVVDAVFRKHGWPGVRRLLTDAQSEDGMFATLTGLLGVAVTRETFEAWWRREAPRALAARSARR